VLSSSAASVTFSSIPQGFKHLQIRAIARTDRGFGNDTLGLRVNGDTGSNYARHILRGTGSSVVSGAVTSTSAWGIQSISASSAETGNFAPVVVDLLDYASTSKNTTMRAINGFHTASYGFYEISLNSGLWMNTAAVTELNFYSITGFNFISGTRFSLYGIRG
jgi:hypothetical protein